jgi:hypothetical protein
MCFSADGKKLYIMPFGWSVQEYDVASGARLRVFTPALPFASGESAYEWSTALAASPTGDFLAGAGPWGLAVWRLTDGSLIHVSREAASQLFFSADGRRLMSDDILGSMRIYDTASKATVRVALRADGAWAAWNDAGQFQGTDDGVAMLRVDSGYSSVPAPDMLNQRVSAETSWGMPELPTLIADLKQGWVR